MKIGAFSATSLVALSLCGAVKAAPIYQVTNLGTPGAFAYGVNASAQVTGQMSVTGNDHAFLYSAGTTQDLGTLNGNGSVGWDINDSGQVTGSKFSGTDHAFLYSGGTMLDLGTFAGNGGLYFGEGRDINDSGNVTGYSTTAGLAANHAFLYASGAMQDLGTLGGRDSFGMGINDIGDVTGRAYLAGDSAYHAFLYSAGIMHDLGTLSGGNNSQGLDINATGQVVGRAETATGEHAFLYDNGQLLDLDALLDLGDPDVAGGLVLSQANGINDSGQIVAYGCRFGVCASYLLTVAADEAVFEPTSLAIFSGAVGGLGWLRRRKRA